MTSPDGSGATPTPPRNSSPNSARRCGLHGPASPPRPATITVVTFEAGSKSCGLMLGRSSPWRAKAQSAVDYLNTLFGHDTGGD